MCLRPQPTPEPSNPVCAPRWLDTEEAHWHRARALLTLSDADRDVLAARLGAYAAAGHPATPGEDLTALHRCEKYLLPRRRPVTSPLATLVPPPLAPETLEVADADRTVERGSISIDERQAEDFAEAIRREAGAVARKATLPSIAPVAGLQRLLEADGLQLGIADVGGGIAIDLARLIDGRLLVQGASGAGKSWTLRRLLEQSFDTIQQIVIDPEGEFSSLAVAKGHLRLDAARLDIAALSTAARSVRAHRLSVLLDLSDCEREDQMIAVATFLRALIDAPREDWHAALVAIDEAHLFAPFGGDAAAPSSVRKAAIGALTDLMSRGRKRGLCGVLATQRLARLSKSVASEAVNFLVGLNTLDLDIRRAAETIGWDARRAFDRLPMLEPGDFVAVGPAFSRSPAVLRVGAVETHHRGAAPALARPERRTVDEASKLLNLEALMAGSQADAALRDDGAPEGLRIVRAFIRDPGFSLAGRVLEVLKPLSPHGATLVDVAIELDVTLDRLSEACALLDRYGVLEFEGFDESRAARLAREFRP